MTALIDAPQARSLHTIDAIEKLAFSIFSSVAAYVLQFDEQLRLRYANDAAGAWLHLSPEEMVSRELKECFRADVAEDIITECREVLKTRHPVAIEGVVRGEGLRMAISPILPAASNGAVLQMVCSPLSRIIRDGCQDCAGPQVRMASAHDLGFLERITLREIEVLSSVAIGQSSSELAFSLRRSRRTIDCHRASITSKLGIQSVAEIALLARHAGLVHMQRIVERDNWTLRLALNDRLLKSITESRRRSGTFGRLGLEQSDRERRSFSDMSDTIRVVPKPLKQTYGSAV